MSSQKYCAVKHCVTKVQHNTRHDAHKNDNGIRLCKSIQTQYRFIFIFHSCCILTRFLFPADLIDRN